MIFSIEFLYIFLAFHGTETQSVTEEWKGPALTVRTSDAKLQSLTIKKHSPLAIKLPTGNTTSSSKFQPLSCAKAKTKGSKSVVKDKPKRHRSSDNPNSSTCPATKKTSLSERVNQAVLIQRQRIKLSSKGLVSCHLASR